MSSLPPTRAANTTSANAARMVWFSPSSRVGRLLGKRTHHSICHPVAPAMRADSTTSAGTREKPSSTARVIGGTA